MGGTSSQSGRALQLVRHARAPRRQLRGRGNAANSILAQKLPTRNYGSWCGEELHRWASWRGGQMVWNNEKGLRCLCGSCHCPSPTNGDNNAEWHIREVAGRLGRYCVLNGIFLSKFANQQPKQVKTKNIIKYFSKGLYRISFLLAFFF